MFKGDCDWRIMLTFSIYWFKRKG
uniref:Uncharacterized protein n=1 Tax=Tetranychus urticae TaxID=32264 RepID=T1KP01_TETUR